MADRAEIDPRNMLRSNSELCYLSSDERFQIQSGLRAAIIPQEGMPIGQSGSQGSQDRLVDFIATGPR